jgi:hypothetical protein
MHTSGEEKERSKSYHSVGADDSKNELDLTFYEMNPKEHLWSRLKALQLYESANIFILIFNADDRDSFESLQSIYQDFKEANSQDCYVVLCSVITHDIILRKTQKVIKKTEAQEFIDSRRIPSYCELRLEGKKNFDLLDKHLRYIMQPYLDQTRFAQTDGIFLYMKLFEVIILKYERSKKFNKKTGQWVDRVAEFEQY